MLEARWHLFVKQTRECNAATIFSLKVLSFDYCWSRAFSGAVKKQNPRLWVGFTGITNEITTIPGVFRVAAGKKCAG